MSLDAGRVIAESIRFPRVSGDEPETFRNAVNAAWFSPRERG